MIAQAIIQKLKMQSSLLATVESCTGGLIAHQITQIPGASSVYWGSWVVYHLSAKQALGVPESLLYQEGAVSAAVTKKLADCGLASMQKAFHQPLTFQTQAPVQWMQFFCLSITGLADPHVTEPLPHPAGTYFIGLAISGRATQVQKATLNPLLNRQENKKTMSQHSLLWLSQHLEYFSSS